MSPIKDLVMPHETVVRKLDRMAREMLEVHYNESTLVLIGVDGQGLEVASALARRLRELSSIDIVDQKHNGALETILRNVALHLVDRKHRSFPIRADFCGLTLSTQLTEHIVVDLSDTNNATVHIERPHA